MKFISVSFSICCLLFLMVTTISYFSKRKIDSMENKIFKKLIISNIFLLAIDILGFVVFYYTKSSITLKIMISKIYLILYSMYGYIFLYYIAYISNENNKYTKQIITIICSATTLLTLITPLSIETVNDTIIPTGTSMYFAYSSGLFLIVYSVYVFIKNNQVIKTKIKKFIPIICLFIFSVLALVIQFFNTGIGLLLTVDTLVTFIMYHTIENPDVKMLEEVSLAKESAEKANNAKSDFLSNMSHEIRTPLNAIVGFSESLKEDNLSEESRNKVEDIITASNNLLEIVNGILDISKIEANKLEIINKEYDVHSMFDELVSLTKARIGTRDLEFYVDIDKSLPSILYGDNVRLKQIILNILTNAVKYTKEGSIHFTVSTVIKDNICRLIISVEDTGIGMKEESLNKLFTKFERLNVEKQITIEGTGLGLAITKKLVDLMNGKIIVQSVYGKGSKFTVSIDQRIVAVEKPATKLPAKSESKVVDANGARILLVDDNELNIKVAATLLKKYNFNIDSCTSAIACIAKLNNGENYDVIFMDDMMPKMTGKEAVKKLKSNPDFKTPVIVLTANAITGMREEYLAAGFDDYLSKPIEKKELERVIKEHIHKTNTTNMNTSTSRATNSILENQIDLDKTIILKQINNSNYSNKKILLVDDNELNIKVALTTLKKYDLDITTATSGSECIEKVIENKYDLILLDDMMPELDGCETLDNLKTLEDFNTPVVMMTASSRDEVEDKINKHGFDGYLSKPINKEYLEELFDTLLNK